MVENHSNKNSTFKVDRAVLNLLFALVAIAILGINLTGCISLWRYQVVHDDRESNVSLIFRNTGGTPRNIIFNIHIDGIEVIEKVKVRSESRTIKAAHINLDSGSHRLSVKISDYGIEAEKEIEVSDQKLYFSIEYENRKGSCPSITIKAIDYLPGFA